MGPTRPSVQELIGRGRRAGFVGRVDERAAFRRNLDLAAEDERHRFLFHVHGDAGVGKTFLVRDDPADAPLEPFLVLPAAERADIAERLTELLTGRDALGGVGD